MKLPNPALAATLASVLACPSQPTVRESGVTNTAGPSQAAIVLPGQTGEVDVARWHAQVKADHPLDRSTARRSRS
jgi:hypothetical protein